MNLSMFMIMLIMLVAACIFVPLATRWGLGAVLGYLVAGVLIGPSALGLVADSKQIMHIGEFGVVMMLFLIGLELQPAMLWRLRQMIAGLGALQVIICALVLGGIAYALGMAPSSSIAIGLALAMSSTALVIPTLKDQGLEQSPAGRSAFAVLLFQDISVIPILLLLPLLAVSYPGSGHGAGGHGPSLISGLEPWMQFLSPLLVIITVIAFGRYAARSVFMIMARTLLREIFVAGALCLVVGVSVLMQAVGLSPALGAFIAGVTLANSEYRRAIESDIEPFKGLLLGVFFLSVGMGMDLGLALKEPLLILCIVGGLMLTKAIIIVGLARLFRLDNANSLSLALILSQGGEFGFVLFSLSQNLGLFDSRIAGILNLSVALSIALTPLLFLLYMRFRHKLSPTAPEKHYDEFEEKNPVIIAGYGRFGQIIARYLRGQSIQVTILEKNPDQVEFIRKFGFQSYFGDASRHDLLKQAGIEHSKIFIIAVDDADAAVDMAKLVKAHYPKVIIFARARNRRHAYDLHRAGVDYFHRELLDSSLIMAQEALIALGRSRDEALAKTDLFRAHDVAGLESSFELFEDDKALIDYARLRTEELSRILSDDANVKEKP